MEGNKKSPLQIARASYEPKLPIALKGSVAIKEGEKTESIENQKEIKEYKRETEKPDIRIIFVTR